MDREIRPEPDQRKEPPSENTVYYICGGNHNI